MPLQDLLWAALYIVANVVVFADAFFLGSWILASFLIAVKSPPRLTMLGWTFLASAAGLGLLGWLTLLLGFVLPYKPMLYRLSDGLLLVLGSIWWTCSGKAREARSWLTAAVRPGIVEGTAWLLLGVTGAYIGFLQLFGINGSDGQTFHLYNVLLWQHAGRFVPIVGQFDGVPITISGLQPLGGQLLLLHVSLVGSVYASGLFNVAVIALATVGVFTLGSAVFDERIGRLGALVFLTSPALVRVFAWDVNDYLINLVLVLGVCTGLTFTVRAREPAWLPIIALYAGLLYGVKEYALLELALLTVIGVPAMRKVGLLGAAAPWLPMSVLLALPWVLYKIVLFHNPLWPYFRSVLGGVPLPPSWTLFFAARMYDMLMPFLGDGHTPYVLALWQFWYHELLPPFRSPWAFSPFFVPALVYWTVTAWRNPCCRPPLVFAAGFLAVGLSSIAFNKYMILVIGPTAPFIARVLGEVHLPERARRVAAPVVAVFILLVAGDYLHEFGGLARWLRYRREVASAQPLKTLNALPPEAVVLGNFHVMGIRYSRIYWRFNAISDLGELINDDWRRFLAFYRKRGVTHYLVERQSDEFPYARLLPWIGRYDSELSHYVTARANVYAANRAARDRYLYENGEVIMHEDGYVLYRLLPAREHL